MIRLRRSRLCLAVGSCVSLTSLLVSLRQVTDARLKKFLSAFDTVSLFTDVHTWPPLHETDSQRLVCIRVKNIVREIISYTPDELCEGTAAADIMEQV